MSGPALTLVAALDRRGAIGVGNALPWHLPDDFRHFKAITLGKPLLMGRRTAESLGRALPGRRNLVLTRSGRVPFEGMEPVGSLAAARQAVAGADELMVIGGGEIYALALPQAARLWLTEVDTTVAQADAFVPPFERGDWIERARTHHPADVRHAFAFDIVLRTRA